MNSISGLHLPAENNVTSGIGKKPKNQTSFADTLKGVLGEVNDLQAESKQSAEKFLNGEISDVHQVMVAAEKASVGLQLTLAVRNKLFDAYREIMRMQG